MGRETKIEKENKKMKRCDDRNVKNIIAIILSTISSFTIAKVYDGGCYRNRDAGEVASGCIQRSRTVIKSGRHGASVGSTKLYGLNKVYYMSTPSVKQNKTKNTDRTCNPQTLSMTS